MKVRAGGVWENIGFNPLMCEFISVLFIHHYRAAPLCQAQCQVLGAQSWHSSISPAALEEFAHSLRIGTNCNFTKFIQKDKTSIDIVQEWGAWTRSRNGHLDLVRSKKAS